MIILNNVVLHSLIIEHIWVLWYHSFTVFSKVCNDYVNGVCSSNESQCLAAHPPLELLRDRNQKRITVCMDFVKGRCQRESCRYFHPPSHLQGKLKTVKISQSQLSVVSKICNLYVS